MNPRLACALLLVSVLGGWGCHGGTATPTSPAPPSATADSLVITSGVDALRTGFFADYVLMATMSDRTTQNATRQAAWTTSDSSVATVDANGRLTAVRNGTVNLNAAFQGRTTTRTVRIVHNFSGQWNGSYLVRSCDQSGIFASSRYCQNLGSSLYPFALQVAQSGPQLDVVSGLISVRGLVAPVAGSVTSDGRLLLAGSYVATDSGVNVRVDIAGWSTAPSSTQGLTGSFVQMSTVAGSEGSATQTNEIVTATQKVDALF